MNKYGKKVKIGFLIMGLCAFLFGANAASADEAILKLSRVTVGGLARGYSPAVKNLESSRNKLQIEYDDLKTAMEGLQTLYDLLPQYKTLYNSYLAVGSITDYQTYLQEAAKGIMGNAEAAENAAAMLIDEVGNPTPLAAELANRDNMQVDEYMKYTGFQTQFSMFGITNPNLTLEEEYKKFVYPINMGPEAMQTGIRNLNVTIDNVEASIYNGAMSLYDSVLMLEGYLQLQTISYGMAQTDLTSATKKYEKDLISEDDYNIAVNKEKIAKLNMQSMARQVENLKMNLNLMIGIGVTTQVKFTSDFDGIVTLKSIDYYIERGIRERNELISLVNNYALKVKEFGYVKSYFNESSVGYKIVASELNEFDLKEKELELQIEKEIREAYLNVLEKEEDIKSAKLTLEDSTRQYESMRRRVDLGYITESTLTGLSIMMIQANNEYLTAQRDYFSAVTALESASSIGPAFSGSGGGTQFE